MEDAREGPRSGAAPSRELGEREGWDAADASGVSLGFNRDSLHREQQAELSGLPTSSDEGKGSPGGDGVRRVGFPPSLPEGVPCTGSTCLQPFAALGPQPHPLDLPHQL